MRTVMTLEEVAAYLRVHQSTVYRLLKAQSSPAFKLGSDWRFNRESIKNGSLKASVLLRWRDEGGGFSRARVYDGSKKTGEGIFRDGALVSYSI